MVKPPGGSRWNFHRLFPSFASSAVTDCSLDMTNTRPSETSGAVVNSSRRSVFQRTAPEKRLRA